MNDLTMYYIKSVKKHAYSISSEGKVKIFILTKSLSAQLGGFFIIILLLSSNKFSLFKNWSYSFFVPDFARFQLCS